MSSVILSVGQCGNQVSKRVLKTLTTDEEVQKSEAYIDQYNKLRSIHVDTEPKVIRHIKKSFSKTIRERNIIVGKRGRGSNWAFGYYGLKSESEDHILNDTEEALRKEIERCDSYNGTILLHSLSGGTGSGLGSKLCEIIRDEYPTNSILSCVVAPFSSGETPLQHYNSLLTLSSLQRNTDGIILSYNDELLYRLQKKGGDKPISLGNINQSLSNNLCGVILPTDTLRPKKGLSLRNEPWELVQSVCPNPSTKFIHINHTAKSKSSWESLIGSSLQNLRKCNKQGKPFSCLSGVVIGRGEQSGSIHQSMMKTLNKKVKTGYNFIEWNPFPLDTWSAKQNKLSGKDCCSITIAANYTNVVEYLETVKDKARLMYDNNAYLHWYWRYGATQDVFTEGFETVQQIIDDYKAAVK